MGQDVPDIDEPTEVGDVTGLLRQALVRLERAAAAGRDRGLPPQLLAAVDDAVLAAGAAERAVLGAAAPVVGVPTAVPEVPALPAATAEESLDLPVSAASAPTARTFVRQACARWGLQGAPAAAAVDVASELVTNAVNHAWATVNLRVEVSDDAIVVRVTDDSPDLPQLLPYVPGRSERGLGLRIVQSLAAHWGHRRTDGGKEVWAVVARPPEPPPAE